MEALRLWCLPRISRTRTDFYSSAELRRNLIGCHFRKYRLRRCSNSDNRRNLMTAIGVEGVTTVVEAVVLVHETLHPLPYAHRIDDSRPPRLTHVQNVEREGGDVAVYDDDTTRGRTHEVLQCQTCRVEVALEEHHLADVVGAEGLVERLPDITHNAGIALHISCETSHARVYHQSPCRRHYTYPVDKHPFADESNQGTPLRFARLFVCSMICLYTSSHSNLL